MADDLLAAAAAVASSPPLPPQPDTSLSNASSPLTEVEDKDGDPDEMELDGSAHKSSPLSNVNIADLEDEDDEAERSDEEQHSRNRNRTRATRSQQRAKAADVHSDNDDESALSEVEPDVNDSEAETERLYDTPTKNKNIKNGSSADVESSPESFTTSPTKRLSSQQSAAARDRTFHASPSKLKQQLRADSDGGNENNNEEEEDDDEEDDDALADAEDEENNEADGEEEAAADDRENTRSSRRRSLAASKDKDPKSAPAPAVKKDDIAGDKDDGTPLPRGQRASSDTRKRKRSPTTDPSESDQPLRKRVGSGTGPGTGKGTSTNATSANTDEAAATNGASGDAAGGADRADRKNDGDNDNSAEGTASDTFRARRSKRGSVKRRGGNSGNKDSDDEGGGNDDLDDERDGAVDDEAAANGEDEPEGDIDEEAEAAHRNEEELERKKAALDNLSAIEKQFASFRDKLYQERLDQLNHEEEMLQGDNPTHPEYLAMMQCIDERRDETKRVVDTELALNMQTLNRWAVARRSHIHGQYFQSIRESREMVLEELGRQWYQIQLQRRRHANTIPDYGLRFPTSKQQRIKDAVSYNTEVSILSGLAKYEGFPAAPAIKGASHHQVDDDLEAIARGRQSEPRAQAQQTPSQTHSQVQAHHVPQGQPQIHGHQHHQGNGTPFTDVGVHGNGVNGVNGNGVGAPPAAAPPSASAPPPTSTHAPVSYHSLGAAGQQFLANTPWANPHHPSHHHSKTAAPLHTSQMHPPSMSQSQSQSQSHVPRDEHLIQRQQQAQQAPSGHPGTTLQANTTGTAPPAARPRARKPLPQGGSRGQGQKAANAKAVAAASAAAAAAANRNPPPPVPDFPTDPSRQSSVPIKREAAAKVTA